MLLAASAETSIAVWAVGQWKRTAAYWRSTATVPWRRAPRKRTARARRMLGLWRTVARMWRGLAAVVVVVVVLLLLLLLLVEVVMRVEVRVAGRARSDGLALAAAAHHLVGCGAQQQVSFGFSSAGRAS